MGQIDSQFGHYSSNFKKWTSWPAKGVLSCQLGQSSLEEASFRLLLGELKGMLVGVARFVDTREAAAHVGAGGVGEVIIP